MQIKSYKQTYKNYKKLYRDRETSQVCYLNDLPRVCLGGSVIKPIKTYKNMYKNTQTHITTYIKHITTYIKHIKTYIKRINTHIYIYITYKPVYNL